MSEISYDDKIDSGDNSKWGGMKCHGFWFKFSAKAMLLVRFSLVDSGCYVVIHCYQYCYLMPSLRTDMFAISQFMPFLKGVHAMKSIYLIYTFNPQSLHPTHTCSHSRVRSRTGDASRSSNLVVAVALPGLVRWLIRRVHIQSLLVQVCIHTP